MLLLWPVFYYERDWSIRLLVLGLMLVCYIEGRIAEYAKNN